MPISGAAGGKNPGRFEFPKPNGDTRGGAWGALGPGSRKKGGQGGGYRFNPQKIPGYRSRACFSMVGFEHG